MDAALENIEKEDFNILADVSCIIFIKTLFLSLTLLSYITILHHFCMYTSKKNVCLSPRKFFFYGTSLRIIKQAKIYSVIVRYIALYNR